MRQPGSLRRAGLLAVCAAALLLIPAMEIVAQGTVTGVVRDATTNEPLAGVNVQIEGTPLGQLTQDNGRFQFVMVPAGTYTVSARLIGYRTVKEENVLVTVDGRAIVNFDLPSEAVELQEVVVQARAAAADHIVQQTGSRDLITAEEIEALPVASLTDVLALSHGVLEVDRSNPEMISQLDMARGVNPLYVRGGDSDETIMIVDGIDMSDRVLGDHIQNPSAIEIEQVDFQRGGLGAEYGALSGAINVRTRQPRNYYQGTVSYRTSALGGLLGSRYNELRGQHRVEGIFLGPVPGAERLRFSLSGTLDERASSVHVFDDLIWDPLMYRRDQRGLYQSGMDLIPGARAFGFVQNRSASFKLTYPFTGATSLEAQVRTTHNKSQPYSRSFIQTGWDLHAQCLALYPELADVCAARYLSGIMPETVEDLQGSWMERAWVQQASIERTSVSYQTQFNHTAGLANFQLSAGLTFSERETCTFVSGVCLGDRLAATGTNASFASSGGSRNYGVHPIYGTSNNVGGNDSRRWNIRGNVTWQASDHHQIRGGFDMSEDRVNFREARNIGPGEVQLEWEEYTSAPSDGAIHLQDRIEYDFITLILGVRFQYSRAGGTFFSNTQDPTAGTTAFHVCRAPQEWGLPPDIFQHYDRQTEQMVHGIMACAMNSELMEMATIRAMEDDFEASRPRRNISPRVNVSFPVTEDARVFFNWGRIAQDPSYSRLYRMTGIGTPYEGTRDALEFVRQSYRASPMIGNPHLLPQRTTSYELGFNSVFGPGKRWTFQTTMYMRDQFGMTGIRPGGIDEMGRPVFDPGMTYGSTTYSYTTTMNTAFRTSRGLEFTLRRLQHEYWGMTLRYSTSQVRENQAPPELEYQRRMDEGDQPIMTEARSRLERPHSFSGSLTFRVGARTPDIPFGELLRQSSLSFTGSARSGAPFTPQLDLAGDQRLLRNAADAPWVMSVNMRAQKSFTHGQLQFGPYVDIRNLFNWEDCTQVFASTGRCDGGALTQQRVQYGSAAAMGTLSQNWDFPEYRAPPRVINAGVQVNFR